MLSRTELSGSGKGGGFGTDGLKSVPSRPKRCQEGASGACKSKRLSWTRAVPARAAGALPRRSRGAIWRPSERLSDNNPRRRPTLPHSHPCSTIGAEGLNCRVRNGNGCFPLAIATGKTWKEQTMPRPNPGGSALAAATESSHDDKIRLSSALGQWSSPVTD